MKAGAPRERKRAAQEQPDRTQRKVAMKLHRFVVLALVALSLVAAAVALADAAGRKASSREARVERGRYLTLMGGCNDCHTPGTFYGSADYNRTLSGSELGWVGPWGVTFPRNLTPDLETG